MLPTSGTIDGLRHRFDQEMPHYRRNADILVYRDFVARHDQLINVPEMGKDNGLAIRFRQSGNRAFSSLQFDEALRLYNQSICFAESESEHLGIGYANRSSVYYELGEYEFALWNIDLAKKHNYPKVFMPKLLSRETNCKERIVAGHSKGTVPHSMVKMSVDVNPKIPTLANGIDMKQYEDVDRGLVAVHDFNAGDVILDEKVGLCFVSFGYTTCGHCGANFLNSLIPCPSCVFLMYCSAECRKKDFRYAHRFECSVVTKLWNVTHPDMMVMTRLFFYGLTAFNDNITELSNYCLSRDAIGSKPLDLDMDFVNPDPLELFKMIHQAKPNRNPAMEHLLKLSVASFHAVFLKNPLVQSMFYTAAQRRFMLRCMLIHVRVSLSLALKREDDRGAWTGSFSPIVPLLNHSCDPNAVAVVDSGRIEIIVLRPIERGTQIVISYGPTWWSEDGGSELAFQCKCVVCDRGPEGVKWREARKEARPISSEAKREMCEIGGEVPNLVKVQRIVQILARDGHHPGKLFGDTVKVYHDMLVETVRQENEKVQRAKLIKKIAGKVVLGDASG